MHDCGHENDSTLGSRLNGPKAEKLSGSHACMISFHFLPDAMRWKSLSSRLQTGLMSIAAGLKVMELPHASGVSQKCGHKVAATLLGGGADSHVKDQAGHTPMDIAIISLSFQEIRQLLHNHMK